MGYMDSFPEDRQARIVPIKRSPLVIVDWEYGCDLRDYGWSEDAVREVVRKYKLQHRQAVVFFNNSKMFGGSGSHPPKCRIYWMWNGQALTIIPPVKRSNAQVDYQHDFNAWLRAHFGTAKNLDGFFDEYEARYATTKQRRESAKQARKKLGAEVAFYF